MSVIRSIIIAFSMYSKIPMPKVEWKDSNMRLAIGFFPLVGMVIGGCIFSWWKWCQAYGLNPLLRTGILLAIPLLLTGGIHIDGYMDTMDAFHSYGSGDRKREILKDPHIGGFSVIMLFLYYMIMMGCVAALEEDGTMAVFSLGFILARALSGIAVVSFRAAFQEGLLFTFQKASHRKGVQALLLFQLAVTLLIMVLIRPVMGICVGLGNAFLFYYYRRRAYRELGGVTGDLAGWFSSISELVTGIIAVMIQTGGY